MFTSYLGRSIDPSKKVRVYRNLNKPGVVYSIQQSGKVVGYSTDITLTDAKCVVQEGARQRVIAKQCREVHAWIEGKVAYREVHAFIDGNVCSTPAEGLTRELSYNPYKGASFYDVATGQPVTSAPVMRFNDKYVKY